MSEEQERAALALAVVEGDKMAERRLRDLEAEQAEAERRKAWAELAARERARREEVARAEAAEKARQKAEREHARLRREQHGAAEQIEESAKALVALLAEMVERGRAIGATGEAAGIAEAHVGADPRVTIKRRLDALLFPVLGPGLGDWPPAWYRQPLAALFPG